LRAGPAPFIGRGCPSSTPGTVRVKVIGFRPHGAGPQAPPLVAPAPAALGEAAALLRSVAPFDLTVAWRSCGHRRQ